MVTKIKYSVIVPVYNRPPEVDELLESLTRQQRDDIEVIVVEDGSTLPCAEIVEKWHNQGLNTQYIFKENEGRSIARNKGIENARGEWLIFFDSDCVIPKGYFETLDNHLALDSTIACFGGPDAAADSFTDTQKAINVAMTSFLTTGGIRGGKVSLEKFTPRTFNMGFRIEVFERVGGFREMFSEDIDMSLRIRNENFKTALIPDAKVWHKRRIDWHKFMRQVYVFGMSRITLKLLYPGSMKVVHTLPALALLIGIFLIIASIIWSPWWIAPLALYLLAIFFSALFTTKNLKIAAMAVPASIIQIAGYGAGFLKAWFVKILLGKGRDVKEEIRLRKGK